jgi:exosome complex component RRP43
VVRLGNTVAVCGIRAEILKAEADVEAPSSTEEDEDLDNDDVRDLSLLVPNFELSTGSTPLLLPGNAPSAFAQTLTTRIRNLLLSTKLIRARDLRILYSPSTTLDSEMADSAEGTDPSAQIQSGGIGDEQQVLVKGYWVLYIDTLFVSLDGNAFDAAWLGILAALRDTKLPRAFFDEEYEDILCSDSPSEARKSDLRGLPVPSTFAVFEGGEGGEEARDWVLTDPDAFEESVCKESVCVVVDCESGDGDAMIRKVEKSGGGVVDRVLLRGLVERARERWGVWRDVLSKVG